MLSVEGLGATYGAVPAVRDATFTLADGEVLAVLGPNGAGKSTLAGALCGLHRERTGRVLLDGVDLGAAGTTDTARAGIVLVPQGRRVFGSCTVAEHVALSGIHSRPGAPDVELLLGYFPRLRERWTVRARQLSGGEQQMLAITRAVLLGPRVLVLDEPTEGLAPAIVDAVAALVRALRDDGISVLLLEQHGPFPRSVADRVVTMDRGTVSAPEPALRGGC
ncbi:MAG TPA: ATP-binding cassette domain-containing protein [Marmoricola sp.]|nr:ATP-binding cassette domain-containing protein [Marmoricola sp.]